MGNISYDEYFAKEEKKPGTGKKLFETIMILIVACALIYTLYEMFMIYRSSLSMVKTVYPVYLDNSVTVYHYNKKEWKTHRDDFNLLPGDRLVTGNATTTILGYGNGNNFRLAPLTDISYRTATVDALIMALYEGRLWAELNGGKVRVDTYRGSVYIDSGSAGVSVNRNGTVSVVCFTGPVEVETPSAVNNYIVLSPGQEVTINTNNQLTSVKKYSMASLDRWERWNTSFSAIKMKDGQKPPPYEFLAHDGDAQNVLNRSRRRLARANRYNYNLGNRNPNSPGGPDVYSPQHYNSWKDVPMLCSPQNVTGGGGEDPREPLPSIIPYTEGEEQELPPNIPDRALMRDDVENKNAAERMKERDKDTLKQPDAPGVGEKRNDSQPTPIDKKQRKTKDGMYYLLNDYRLKNSSVKHPPGYGINEKPIGPARQKNNKGF